MFSNAGMNQFKNVFTGAEAAKGPRAATSQKCVRAGGKHNDLDNVGYTARHHTFFEMLGNFSFGDYFKEGAISFAWELLTKNFGLNPDKMLATVYHTDDEAFALWKKIAGFPDHKIIRIPTKDNFWQMGDTGPCGPCSEIFYDHGEHIPGGPPGSPDEDGDRFIEIWNLVFMQFDRQPDGTDVALPKPSIDTGMGLERISAVLQGVHDNYDIDLFKNLIRASEELTKTKAEGDKRASHRVIADHLRASCFLMADGVLPSNEGRGYVLRRIMRRAMRHAHLLGAKEPLMHRLVPALLAEMGGAYPELNRAEALIKENLRLEEERFQTTLSRGLGLLEEETAALAKGGVLKGETAFKLYDTYGFPLDLTQDILRGKGMTVDTAGFDASMAEQKARARAAWSGSGDAAAKKIWLELRDKLGATEFLGYAENKAMGKVLAIIEGEKEVPSASAGKEVFVITNQTPFYGASGGQLGDTGTFHKNSKKAGDVLDTTKPAEGLHVHKVLLSGDLKVGDELELHIDNERRARLKANHSATHLLNAALRRVLGAHVSQKGSEVAAERLRFDISHPKPLTFEEVVAVENEVNHQIWLNLPTTTKLMPTQAAIEAGAVAMFGEKYGDEVRVLSMGENDYSVELCGGTHVARTGDIGLFKITGESALAAGVRRIEAVTRDGAFNYLTDRARMLSGLALDMKIPVAEVPEKIAALQAEKKKLEKDLADAKKKLAMGGTGGAAFEQASIGDIIYASKSLEGIDPKDLRGIATEILAKIGKGVVAVGSNVDGKAALVIAASKDSGADSAALIRIATPAVGGQGGGGKPEMAQGGGPDGSKIGEALNAIAQALQSKAA